MSRPLTRDERVLVVKLLRAAARQEKARAIEGHHVAVREKHQRRRAELNDLATAFERREVGG